MRSFLAIVDVKCETSVRLINVRVTGSDGGNATGGEGVIRQVIMLRITSAGRNTIDNTFRANG